MSWDGKDRRGMSFTSTEKERLFKDLDDIKHILNGNSHPENGLVYKNQKNTDFRVFWEKFGWLILATFSGVPCTVIAGVILHMVKRSG